MRTRSRMLGGFIRDRVKDDSGEIRRKVDWFAPWRLLLFSHAFFFNNKMGRMDFHHTKKKRLNAWQIMLKEILFTYYSFYILMTMASPTFLSFVGSATDARRKGLVFCLSIHRSR
jgi:hypothetical protein